MNRKTAHGLLAVALVCAAALPAAATSPHQHVISRNWKCLIELPDSLSNPNFSEIPDGTEKSATQSTLHCGRIGSQPWNAGIACGITLPKSTFNNLGIKGIKILSSVPCRINATGCGVGLGVRQVLGVLILNAPLRRASLLCGAAFEQQ